MTAPQRLYTPEEYLDFERASEGKHEYLDGRVFAMSGITPNHDRIAGEITASLRVQLRGRPCESFTGEMRLKVSATGLYTYPDASALCGTPEFAWHQGVAMLLNPSLLVEVLSPSTEAYDRGAKFAHYRGLPSLREHLLVAQDYVHAERYVPSPAPDAAWVRADFDGPDAVVQLPSVGVRLRLGDLYERVEFPAHPAHPPRPSRVREPEPAYDA